MAPPPAVAPAELLMSRPSCALCCSYRRTTSVAVVRVGSPLGASPPCASSVVDRVAGDGAGHAVAAAAAAAELGADDGDDLDSGLAEQGVGGGVAVVGEDHAGLDGDGVVAAV